MPTRCLDSLARWRSPITRGFDIISLCLFTQNFTSNRPVDTLMLMSVSYWYNFASSPGNEFSSSSGSPSARVSP